MGKLRAFFIKGRSGVSVWAILLSIFQFFCVLSCVSFQGGNLCRATVSCVCDFGGSSFLTGGGWLAPTHKGPQSWGVVGGGGQKIITLVIAETGMKVFSHQKNRCTT